MSWPSRTVVRVFGAAQSHSFPVLGLVAAMRPRPSQDNPAAQIPEKSFAYRFLKKHWLNDFGTYEEFDRGREVVQLAQTAH
jgi:hypothetical protein